MEFFRRRPATREEVAQGQEEMRREAERLSAGRSREESKLEKEGEDPLDQPLQEQRASGGREEAEQQDVEDEKSARGSAQSLEPPTGLKEEEIKDVFGQEGQPMLQR